MAKFPSGSGSTPKGKGGPNSGSTRGGPGMGKAVTADNKVMNPAKPAGGAAHKSSGGGERKGFYPNAPKDFPSLNGKLNKVRDTW